MALELRGRRVGSLLESLAGRSTPTPRPTANWTSASDAPHPAPVSARASAAAPQSERLRAFLESRGFRLVRVPTTMPHDRALDDLALMLASDARRLAPLYRGIRQRMTTGGPFTLPRRGVDATQLHTWVQFCRAAHRLALLRGFGLRSGRQQGFWVDVQACGVSHAFFAGGWLERFVSHALRRVWQAANLPFEDLRNAVVSMPNGHEFELDYIAWVSGRILWVECKTAEYQRAVSKYRQAARSLGLPANSVGLVVTRHSGSAVAASVGSLFGLTMLRPAEVAAFGSAWLRHRRTSGRMEPPKSRG